MSQKLTKMQAAARLDVSQSTIDRMIQKGDLQIEKEPHGSRFRIWVLMDREDAGSSADRSVDVSDNSPEGSHHASSDERSDVADMSEAIELAVLRERVRNLEELADYHREQLKDSEWRYQQAMEQLGASQRIVDVITKALPAADPGSPIQRRRWWPFGKGRN